MQSAIDRPRQNAPAPPMRRQNRTEPPHPTSSLRAARLGGVATQRAIDQNLADTTSHRGKPTRQNPTSLTNRNNCPAPLPQPQSPSQIRTLPNPCRRAAESTPRGKGIRPQSIGGRFLRTRTFTTATTTSAATSTSPATRGRNNEVSTPNIRQTGRKIRAACGAAINKATISGCPKTARN